MTKKGMICMTLAAALMAMGGSFTANADTMELAWNVPDPDGHPWTESAYDIAEEIESRSEGSLKVTVYPNNQMGVADAIEMMSTGSLAMDLTGPAGFGSYYAPMEIFTLPYAFDSVAQAYAYFESEPAQEMFRKVEDITAIKTLSAWYFGDRDLTTKGVEVHTPSDLDGVAIRCMDTIGSKAVIQALGGSPVPMPLSETYLSLQTGVVSGQENPLPTIVAQKFNEVQDYLILTRHSIHMGTIHFSKMIWDQLTEEQQNIITEVLAEYQPIVEERIIESQESNLELLKNDGMKVIEVDMDAFKENAANVINATYSDNAEWMKAINDLTSFKEEWNANNPE